jgi:hypothetical protein
MDYLKPNNFIASVNFKQLSLYTVVFIFLYCLFNAQSDKNWFGDTPYAHDSKMYYSYLPKFFLEHDIEYNNAQDYWLEPLPNGKHIMKFTCGLAMLAAPFFLLAWAYCSIMGIAVDPYSQTFIEFVHYGDFLYFLIGLLCIRKTLQYFKVGELAICISLLSVFFGTNLYCYILGQTFMSHGFLFSLHAIFLYRIIKFYEKTNFLNVSLLALAGALITLIRPVEILCFLVWALWEVNTIEKLKNRFIFLLSNWKYLIVMFLVSLIVFLPQMLYWHLITGKFLFYSYASGERMFFDDPKIYEILFGYRSSMFMYSPITLFYVIALLFFKNENRISFLLFFALTVYIVSSWWCWWYGGSYGMRSLIQMYPYLVVPFAVLLNKMFKSQYKFKVVNNSLTLLVIIFLCGFQMKNYKLLKKGFMHYDSMSKESYWFVANKFELSSEEGQKFYTLLNHPDYDKAKQGIR